MYANFKSFLFQMIPGYCVSDLVYLGVIVFIIAGFLSSKKWTPFFASVIFALVFKLLDLLVLNQSANILVEQFLHMIVLPFILTILYSKRS
ncbi:MAG: hypothetical protein IKP65_00805 [Alphaproteobacteria bacterium]|nr:hypothetical protein [Alphaproteobacteria bacterium]